MKLSLSVIPASINVIMQFEANASNLRKTWGLVRECQGKSQIRDSIPSTLNCNGKQVIGALNIANGFNEFFARVGPELAWTFDDVDAEAIPPPPHHSAESFTFCKVTEGMVLEFLGKMQSKCNQGPNGISTKLLKVIIPHILSPLTHCFNLNFQSAFVAPQFRSACVIPVYKSGKRDDYYRHISLLSSMC